MLRLGNVPLPWRPRQRYLFLFAAVFLAEIRFAETFFGPVIVAEDFFGLVFLAVVPVPFRFGSALFPALAPAIPPPTAPTAAPSGPYSDPAAAPPATPTSTVLLPVAHMTCSRTDRSLYDRHTLAVVNARKQGAARTTRGNNRRRENHASWAPGLKCLAQTHLLRKSLSCLEFGLPRA
jgi:hypothetical protein